MSDPSPLLWVVIFPFFPRQESLWSGAGPYWGCLHTASTCGADLDGPLLKGMLEEEGLQKSTGAGCTVGKLGGVFALN